jgi:hypothetical protein
MNFLAQAWDFKFSLLPVLSTYTVFEIPALIRRYYRWLYTPIYFIFFSARSFRPVVRPVFQ